MGKVDDVFLSPNAIYIFFGLHVCEFISLNMKKHFYAKLSEMYGSLEILYMEIGCTLFCFIIF